MPGLFYGWHFEIGMMSLKENYLWFIYDELSKFAESGIGLLIKCMLTFSENEWD